MWTLLTLERLRVWCECTLAVFQVQEIFKIALDIYIPSFYEVEGLDESAASSDASCFMNSM